MSWPGHAVIGVQGRSTSGARWRILKSAASVTVSFGACRRLWRNGSGGIARTEWHLGPLAVNFNTIYAVRKVGRSTPPRSRPRSRLSLSASSGRGAPKVAVASA
jgi:hypothetical protein